MEISKRIAYKEYGINNFQMLDLFKEGGIFQCFFQKKTVSKLHFFKPH